MNTLNDLPLLSARIHEPRTGLWHADVEADSQVDLAGAVAIAIEGAVTFSGVVHRGGVHKGRWSGRVVGGAGGLSKVVGPTFYRTVPFSVVAANVLGAGGEKIDPASDAQFLAFEPGRWQVASLRAGDAIQGMVDAVNSGTVKSDLVWRVTRAGKVLFTRDAYATFEMQHRVVARRPNHGMVTVAPIGAPTLVPGVSFIPENGTASYKVGRVFTEVGDGKLRQTFWTEAA